MGLNLLEKTELWINEITLDHTNLTDLANAVARSLGLSDGEVLVVDVRPRHITLDVLLTAESCLLSKKERRAGSFSLHLINLQASKFFRNQPPISSFLGCLGCMRG